MKKNLTNSKKGISLVVLVLTIIIMTILASAVIISLSDSNIIDQAKDAVKKTNEQQVQEIANLGWADAYTEGARTVEALEAGVKKALIANKLNPEDYNIKVTRSGVTIITGWKKDGFTVVNGKQVLQIGDVVYYDAGVSSYTKGWKVLGADDNGNLLIVSAENVKSSFALGSKDSLEKSQEDYKMGVSKLNSECEPYGYGKGAIGKARSITAEDVNKITGYDPNTYNIGEIDQYGNEVTYSWYGTDKIKYESTLNNKSGTANLIVGSKIFTWYDEKNGTFPSVTAGDTSKPLPTLKSTGYTYSTPNLTTINKETNAKAYFTIFRNTSYWLASPYVETGVNSAYFGLYQVFSSSVSAHGYLFAASGNVDDIRISDVRAVVTLSKDITFTGNSNDGWRY